MKRGADGGCQRRTGDNRVRDEWQLAGMTTDLSHCVRDQSRFDIQLTIPDSRLGTGMSVVHFIRMQDHYLLWRADARGATIVESQDA